MLSFAGLFATQPCFLPLCVLYNPVSVLLAAINFFIAACNVNVADFVYSNRRGKFSMKTRRYVGKS